MPNIPTICVYKHIVHHLFVEKVIKQPTREWSLQSHLIVQIILYHLVIIIIIFAATARDSGLLLQTE